MSKAKEMRKQARQMYRMAEQMELIEIAQTGGPDALQKFATKKLQQKLNRKYQSQLRSAVKKSLGI